MTHNAAPRSDELPSPQQLARASWAAVVAALVILVTTVLPGEYGIDPTGIGRVLGLTKMGEMKRDEAALPAAVPQAVVADSAPRLVTMTEGAPTVEPSAPVAGPKTDEVQLTLQPNEGTEVKAVMKAGDEFNYTWSTDGAEVRFDLHGEPHGAAKNIFTSYEKGTSTGATGKFRAPFDGTHGWFWRNKTPNPVIITIRTSGNYEKESQLK